MIRIPNKLYRFEETIFADFVTILRAIDAEPVDVYGLHDRLISQIAIEDMIDALVLLLTLGTLRLDTENGVINRAN